MANSYKQLLQKFIEFKGNEHTGLGYGGNEIGEYAYITLDEWNTEHMLSLKLYSNGEYRFENEFYNEDGEMIHQTIVLDVSDLEILPDNLKNKLQLYLLDQQNKFLSW